MSSRIIPCILNCHCVVNSRRSIVNGSARMASSCSSTSGLLVAKDDVVRFIGECMKKVGADANDSAVVAHHLMTADYRGHFSHGMNRVPMYIKDIETKTTDVHGKPKIINDFQATALVDGQNGLGQVIGKFCMELAIQKAKTFGIGMVSARGSNHYGICGYYTLMAAEKGLIGFSCTNASPLMVPTRASAGALGTNPFSLGMKTQKDEFILDMATTAVALGKIEVAINKEQDIPDGWAMDKDGHVTNDAKEAYETGKLMPLGGVERNSGYKGYGLGTMVEILCGVLSGSHFGPNIRSWKDNDRIADLGQCFMAINPQVFAPGADLRLEQLLGQLRGLPAAKDAPGSIMVAGDPERKAMAKADAEGGIRYHPNQIKICNEIAQKLRVTPLRII